MKIIQLAIRTLGRFKLYTGINILGLALSLACVIVIFRYIHSEKNTDHFNSRLEQIYLSVRDWSEESQPIFFTTQNVLLKRDYKDPLDIPDVEKSSSFVSLKDVNIKVDNRLFGVHVLATDTSFLQILDYPLLEGERNKVLSEPTDAVITQSLAQKLFGNENPIGKTFDYNENILTIKGLIGKTSTRSSLHFDLLISRQLQWRWPPINYYSIALLVPGTDINKINQKIKNEHQLKSNNKSFFFQLFPMSKLYMDTTIDKGEHAFSQGNIQSIQILSIVAILILIIGMLNYIHINSVIALKRGRELGMKKVFGAKFRQILIQLYAENFVLILFALILGWTFIEITHNLQINILGIQSFESNKFAILLSVGFLLGLPFITSLYPFWHYHRIQTTVSLKEIGSAKGKINTRSLFLTVQYVITICLIASSLFFIKQLNLMLHTDPGFTTNNIIKVWFLRPSSAMSYTGTEVEQMEKMGIYILEKVKSSPLFTACSYGATPFDFPIKNAKIRIPGEEWEEVSYIRVSRFYTALFEIPIYSQKNEETQNKTEIFLSESAKKLFTIKGITPYLLEIDQYGSVEPRIVAGFFPNIQILHLSKPNIPIALEIGETTIFYSEKLLASFIPEKKQEAIQFLKNLHDETIGGEFEYSFIEDDVQKLYSKDKQIASIYSAFAIIAILISSLGLFSLSLFDVQQRYQEIAIRKVNGATTSIIIKLLLKKYFVLFGIASAIAVPITWTTITRYLEEFTVKASISWWLFAIALLITVGISLTTLIFHIRKAARTNPAKALKTE